jgi:hypothetical protein
VEDWGFWTKVRWRKLGVSWRNTAELAEQHAEELERDIKDGLDSRRRGINGMDCGFPARRSGLVLGGHGRHMPTSGLCPDEATEPLTVK